MQLFCLYIRTSLLITYYYLCVSYRVKSAVLYQTCERVKMANNSVNFKVFLREENTSEARRFLVDDASVVTNFVFMKEKLQMVFPKLRDVNFRITWKDSDGDEITIDADEDLITAFTEMSGSLKVLYVTVLERKPNQDNFQATDGQFHGFRGRVICDVCETPITGYRYKCMQCPDYDLCANCEFDGHHSEHMMLRTSRMEFPFARCTRKIMDHINKSIRKVNHMAYKEACRANKYRGKYDGRRRCQAEFDQQEQPQTSQQNEAAESSNAQQQEQRPNTCPMQDINLEHITPLIYPILDALNNTVNSASADPGNANNPDSNSNNNNNNNYSAGANPQQPNFMDLIRNAINGFFEGAVHAQQQQQQQHQQQNQNQQMPESSNAPTAAAATSSQATSGQQEARNIPMEVEREIDLTKSPSHSSDFTARREPGWTIINNQSSESPRPTAPTPTDRESAKIAEGLKQLLDMGFSDELNLVALLKRFDGNVGEVVKYLFEQNI